MTVRTLARRVAIRLLGGPPRGRMCRCGHLAPAHTGGRPFGCSELACDCRRYRKARLVDVLLFAEQAETEGRDPRAVQRMDGGRGLPRHIWPAPDPSFVDVDATTRAYWDDVAARAIRTTYHPLTLLWDGTTDPELWTEAERIAQAKSVRPAGWDDQPDATQE